MVKMEIKENKKTVAKKPRSKPCNTGKYHVTENLPAVVEEIKEKYATERWTKKNKIIENVDPEDISKILDIYATDLRVDSYTIAEVFNCSASSFDNLMSSEEYNKAWETAKKRRGSLYIMSGYEIATLPFKRAVAGEKISSAFVNSAKVASNYSLMIGQALNQDYVIKRGGESSGGDIHVTVNTGFKLNI